MEQIVLVIHLLLAVALVGAVLMQRSEGGALGMGGGGSGGGLISGRSAANLLTRTTGILATAFMCTSLGLAVLSSKGSERESILDIVPAAEAPARSDEPSVPLSR